VVPVEYGASFGRWIEGEVAPPSGGAIPSTATSLPSVAILASGRGSNALALIERQQLEGYRIAAVISDNTDAPVITVARDRGIMTTTHPRALWGTTLRCQERIADTLLDIAPDIIVLAGFMQILKPWFVDMFVGRLINIHPSLLPKYPGLDTHRRALEAGDTRHGATVHLVDRGVDTGPIIAQVSVPCVSTDTPEELGARVLAQEHRLFPWVVGAIARGEIQPSENSVVISTEAREAGGALGFLLPE
jgi:formyltetrahydrofolate-dependent phosphoribosylglycinamide formyltransferase